MSATNEATGTSVNPETLCGHWMRRQKAYCTRRPHSAGQHRADGDPRPTAASSDDVCGYWMLNAKAPCARKPHANGRHLTAEALAARAARTPGRRIRAPRARGGRDPAAAARWRRAHKFNRLGITEDAFNALLAAQGHACAICRRPFGEGQRICADHDHDCCPPSGRTAKTCGRCIRGLLCVKCNTALGYIEKRRDAVDAYLARYEASKGLKSA